MIPRPLDQFKLAVLDFLPGLLVCFNIADAKRRNCHLGHLVVDDDIAEFDRLVRLSVGASGLAKRVQGAAWLTIYKTESLQPVSELLRSYHKKQGILVGWRSRGEKDGTKKAVHRTVAATIARSVRCLYTAVTTPQEVNKSIDELIGQCYGFPPNIPVRLSDLVNIQKSSWSCVDSYPAQAPFCPFCAARDFEWDDGDSGVYSGLGTCRSCGACVGIEGINRVLS